MDGNALPVSPADLYARLGTLAVPLLIDVRRREAFDADKFLIASARFRSGGCRDNGRRRTVAAISGANPGERR
jgi:hypothetical protein